MFDRPRRRRAARWPLVLLLAVAMVGAAAAWLLIPRDLELVRVEDVRLLGPGTPDGGREPAAEATPMRLEVTFAARRDLAAERARLGLGYVVARLGDCRGGAATEQVVDQRAGYLPDDGRVRRLPSSPDGDVRYRAVFDDELVEEAADGRTRRTPARSAPDGLCFSLYGAAMIGLHARSAAIPLGSLRG